MTVDPALLAEIRFNAFWKNQDGAWRHNTRHEVTAAEREALDRYAWCQPGRTAELNEDGWKTWSATCGGRQ